MRTVLHMKLNLGPIQGLISVLAWSTVSLCWWPSFFEANLRQPTALLSRRSRYSQSLEPLRPNADIGRGYKENVLKNWRYDMIKLSHVAGTECEDMTIMEEWMTYILRDLSWALYLCDYSLIYSVGVPSAVKQGSTLVWPKPTQWSIITVNYNLLKVNL